MDELKQLQRNWNDLAEIDPLWAIASVPGKEHGLWNIEEFFETGKTYVNEALTEICRSGVELRKRTVLDFGCGIGRLTQALADEFDTCYGIDISPKMIDLANKFNRHGNRCKYILNLASDLRIFDCDFFDFIYTAEVLQHMSPELMQMYLKEFIRTLKPGGVLVFQVPVKCLVSDQRTEYLRSLPRYHPKRIKNKLSGIFVGHDISTRYRRLRQLGFSKQFLYDRFGYRPYIQMNTLDEHDICQLMTHLGAEVVNVAAREHPQMLNKLFVVVKSS